jgi:hypothetical protein
MPPARPAPFFPAPQAPPTPPGGEEATGGGGEDGEEEPFLEPGWPHLQLVYEFLLRFIVSAEVKVRRRRRSPRRKQQRALRKNSAATTIQRRQLHGRLLAHAHRKLMISPPAPAPCNCHFRPPARPLPRRRAGQERQEGRRLDVLQQAD